MEQTTRARRTSPQVRVTSRKVVVRPQHVQYETLETIPLGALTAQGMVVGKSIFEHAYRTPEGLVEVDSEDQQIAVFAYADEDALEGVLTAMKERS